MKANWFLFLFCFCIGHRLSAQSFNAGTYNIRYANHGDSAKNNGWGQRYPVIVSMIRFHAMDIFGTQEGLYQQLEDLRNNLPGYTYIGVGRDDGRHAGEHSAIFYRTDKFDLLESGDFWLSTQTDHPNKGWDAALPRICSWGKFREKGTRFVFYMFNLHMDHVGVKARAESAKLILQKISGFPKNIPVILTGDFNVDQHNESYALINHSGILKDVYDLAPVKLATNGTFNSFDPDAGTESRIDHIFVSKAFTAKRYGILTDTYRARRTDSLPANTRNVFIARMPSDHFPVMAELAHGKK
ncbi:endonuclease/exonuclease/phosphatase family protein [Sediminibacterium soli]|uniref:endonuclease/exonuclease/phosphatase family protein n=1 Tax=Sediminibacterium soli TaxID=2698829 RepID=UPI00137B6979|nr:endonuclease/exonuclease/phosphatase family protein [Sediminibacterium soli]NCI45235.1 endonuclease/exonuclease/phosphatase family protein [Sediminibacterium soli]